MTDPDVARRTHRTLEPFHGMIYFAPEAAEEYEALGIAGRDGYFASRAAPMGRVPAEVVIATFYNFNPELVRHAIPGAWDRADPAEIVAARWRAVDRALRSTLGPEVVEGDEMAQAAALAEGPARAASISGRPLFAGHAALAWPDDAHLRLWHATTLLREYRGDGHIAALVSEGLGPCEALVSHALDEDAPVGAAVLRSSRAWSDADWSAAAERMRARGLVADGRFTDAGRDQRRRIEALTDEAAAPAWDALSGDDATRLRRLVRPWSRALLESGIFTGMGRA